MHRPELARILPFALFMVLLALRGALAGPLSDTAFDPRWLYLAQAGLPFALLLAFRSRYTELADGPWTAPGTALGLLVGLAVFALWISPLPGWTRAGEPAAAFVPVTTDGALRWDLIGARSLGAVLVVPVMEELFWRSFLMRWIDRRAFLDLEPARTSWLAVLLSSAVFALAHTLWFAGAIAGVAYALLYRHLGRLRYAVLAHATTNLALAAWVVATRSWSYW